MMVLLIKEGVALELTQKTMSKSGSVMGRRDDERERAKALKGDDEKKRAAQGAFPFFLCSIGLPILPW